jgi:hypothetical protein
MEVRMLSEASPADYFRHLIVPKAGYVVVQQQLTSRTIIINQITQTHQLILISRRTA